jgi:hypothetical protein
MLALAGRMPGLRPLVRLGRLVKLGRQILARFPFLIHGNRANELSAHQWFGASPHQVPSGLPCFLSLAKASAILERSCIFGGGLPAWLGHPKGPLGNVAGLSVSWQQKNIPGRGGRRLVDPIKHHQRIHPGR